MNVRPARLLAVGVLLVVPAAAGAEPGALVGATCGLAAAGFAEGQERTGVVGSGPWHPTDPQAVVLSVTCSIQIGSSDPLAPDAARVSAQGAVLPPTPVTYIVAERGRDVFVCTEVTVYRPPQQPTVHPYDADPQEPGPQCRKASRGGDEVVVVDIAPSDPTTWWCVSVEHGLPPYGYQDVCNPFA